jgi:hypothetical protein
VAKAEVPAARVNMKTRRLVRFTVELHRWG